MSPSFMADGREGRGRPRPPRWGGLYLDPMYLGIEIGGTKLQLGLGRGDGVLQGLWRGNVEVQEGAQGIRRQIQLAVPQLLSRAGLEKERVRGVGIGFGGPVDDLTNTIIKSHHIQG